MNLKRKSFIWAHNEHINKREMYYSGSNIINLGRHLKIITKTIITAYSTLGREK
jgi:erythromycin esterase-like protein